MSSSSAGRSSRAVVGPWLLDVPAVASMGCSAPRTHVELGPCLALGVAPGARSRSRGHGTPSQRQPVEQASDSWTSASVMPRGSKNRVLARVELTSAWATEPSSDSAGSACGEGTFPSLQRALWLVLSAPCSRPHVEVDHPHAADGHCEPFALGGGDDPVQDANCLCLSARELGRRHGRGRMALGWPASGC
jgi:hypothetical protein